MFQPRLNLIQRLFNKKEPASKSLHSVVSALNAIQEESLKENCILVSTDDKAIGSASKGECHRVLKDGHILLHRAFSVFLFNSKRELLLQKRSPTKVTFPGYFTNTCCSHPLFDFEEERIEDDAYGIKLAAIRRLNHELGVPKEELSPVDIKYLTRIIYKSIGDGVWGEHEIDYCLLINKDLTIEPNPEEISEIKYVSRGNFEHFLKSLNDPITPWFKLIAQHKLLKWWDNLESLDNFIDHKTIHSFQ